MADTPWTCAGDGYRYLRQVGDVFLEVLFTWQGCEWHARRVHSSDYSRWGYRKKLRGAKASAMRVARRWNQEVAK